MRGPDWIYCTAPKVFEYDGREWSPDFNLWVKKEDLEGLISEHKIQRIHHKNIETK